MRIFGSERIAGLMSRLGMEEGVPIEHRMVTRAIEGAQKKVEAHNFDIRKHLLEYDDVMNKQREVIYEQRKHLLRGEDLTEEVLGMADDLLQDMMDTYCSEASYSENWDTQGLRESLHRQFNIELGEGDIDFDGIGRDKLKDLLSERVKDHYATKEKELGTPLRRHLEKVVLLQSVDTHWKDHLLAMDSLKEGIGLRGYGQKDPLVEYKREGFAMFTALMDRIKEDTLLRLFKIQVVREDAVSFQPAPIRPEVLRLNRGESGVQKPVHRTEKKVGRNDLCPCGSGKKFKKCCSK
jgi:preprotein translocase subunit SecA